MKKAGVTKVEQPAKQEGATVEEIDDEEAKRLKELAELRERQQVFKSQPKPEKKADAEGEEEDKEKDSWKQKPNHGNGGQTEKYVWHQTLEEVTVYFPLPENTKANQLDVKLGIHDFKIALKGKQETLIEGKWCKKINSGESIWNIERDSGKATMNITIVKYEGKNWWNCLLQGDIEIDTQKVEPENSKLSDLDGETRSTVEKMMFDQAQKQKGLPTSEEQEKRDKLNAFMAAHPEMDFSKAKFT